MLFIKSYYRLEEVANRWNCDIRTLLLFACDGAFAIALPPEIDGKFYYVPNPRDFLKAKPEERVEVALVCATPEAARGIIRDDSGNIITDTDLDAMPYEERKKIRRKSGRTTMPRLEDNQFTITELVITQAELERVERETQEVVDQNSKNSSHNDTKEELDGSAIRPRKRQDRVRNPGSFFDTVITFFEKTTKRTPTEAELWEAVRGWAGFEVKEHRERETELHDGIVIDLPKLRRWYRSAFKEINDINDS